MNIAKIEDHEGFGRCGHCGREALRWVATLTDGRTVGVECAKKILGWKPAVKSYAWTSDFAPVAEHNDAGTAYVLWRHKQGMATRETRDAVLTMVGGAWQEWTRRGWA